jgi:hypothetical protein
MSAFKNLMLYLNDLPLNTVFSIDDIIKQDCSLSYATIERYLDCLDDAEIIKIDHTVVNEKVWIMYEVIINDIYYIKNIELPFSSTMTIKDLRKMTKDEIFRKNYMRKHKLKQLKK